ncbi:hypothetical protein [Photobacterium sp. 1_MG-2023]|uniref:hypothetical protein n=1 Tax=Photobacterium sp. 1_MG-2023 TaxID=3062646 RepID=UPI0026E43609|nr:hypothetical protein [Photobacterium sp. 1_MG-2023]MDO6707915.1 hypothetical protein [Photobacterium sp. 1_MG-2023]
MQEQLAKPIDDNTEIYLVPVIGAAKSKYFSIVAGAVLVVAGAVTGNPALIYAGVGLMAGGVAGLLTPVPKTMEDNGAKNGKANQYFSSLDNSLAQGSCVPLIYGEIMVGSKVLSQGLRTV